MTILQTESLENKSLLEYSCDLKYVMTSNGTKGIANIQTINRRLAQMEKDAPQPRRSSQRNQARTCRIRIPLDTIQVLFAKIQRQQAICLRLFQDQQTPQEYNGFIHEIYQMDKAGEPYFVCGDCRSKIAQHGILTELPRLQEAIQSNQLTPQQKHNLALARLAVLKALLDIFRSNCHGR